MIRCTVGVANGASILLQRVEALIPGVPTMTMKIELTSVTGIATYLKSAL